MYNMREQAMIRSLWFNKDDRVEALKVNRKWDLHKETNKKKCLSGSTYTFMLFVEELL